MQSCLDAHTPPHGTVGRVRAHENTDADRRLATLACAQVTTQTGDEVFFKIKRSTKLSKLQGAYANKVGKDVNSIR